MKLEHLTLDEVCQIHELLTFDFAETDDPISPPGVRDVGLLESAVSRQQTGFGGKLKYATPELSAATLAYGICSNHAFHNGNKRTAVVALLVHLDRNDIVLETTHDELFKMILAVSQHQFAERMLPERTRHRLAAHNDSDSEVLALGTWVRKRSSKTQRGERQIPYRQLRRILHRFGFELEIPSGNSAAIVQITERRDWLGRKRRERIRIASIGYRNEGTPVSIKDLKIVRSACKLNPANGVDSRLFYDNEASVDAFVAQYRSLLRRLARR